MPRVSGSSDKDSPRRRRWQRWRQQQRRAATPQRRQQQRERHPTSAAATAEGCLMTLQEMAVLVAATAADCHVAAETAAAEALSRVGSSRQRHRRHTPAIAATEGCHNVGDAATAASTRQQRRRGATPQETSATVSSPCVSGSSNGGSLRLRGDSSNSSVVMR